MDTPEKSMKILKLEGPVYFLGQVEFRVLEGSLKVNGRHFEASNSQWTCAFSPRSTALLSFEPSSVTAVTSVEFRQLENGLEAIQNCQNNFGTIFEPETEISDYFEQIFKGFYKLKSEENCPIPLMKISEEWTGVLENVTETSIVFVCGHRKVGKSSFSRFLVNGLLNKFEKVDFVDLDPGQTEFTPAGFLARKTFNSATDALLGPPFTHLQVPDDAIYLASSNGSECPLLYCRALQSIKNKMNNNRCGPIVINTMGWMTGLGLELIQYALQVFTPTHILAFMAPESEDVIRKALMTNSFGSQGALTEAQVDSVWIRYMGNPVSDGPRGKHSPADQRNLAYWAYFFGEITAEMNITRFNFRQLSDLRPVVVPLSHLQLACTSREINLFDLIKSSNHVALLESWLLMRVVGLARDEHFERKCGRWVNLLPNGKVTRVAEMSCSGIGLIRSIVKVNPSRIHLHIITPLPLSILSTCNTLILGSQQIPVPMLANDTTSLQAESPGFSTQMVGTDVNGATTRKTRHNMRRK